MSEFDGIRLLTTEQACRYVGMGKTSLREWGKTIGASVKFGRSLRFDRKVIDDYLDSLSPPHKVRD